MQVVTPYVPRVTTGHLAVLILDTALLEHLQHSLAVSVGNIGLATLREDKQLGGLIQRCSNLLEACLALLVHLLIVGKPTRTHHVDITKHIGVRHK